jgi:hypothetical protein
MTPKSSTLAASDALETPVATKAKKKKRKKKKTKEGGGQDGEIHSGMLAGLAAAGVSAADLAAYRSEGAKGGSVKSLLECFGMQFSSSLKEGEEMELTFDS